MFTSINITRTRVRRLSVGRSCGLSLFLYISSCWGDCCVYIQLLVVVVGFGGRAADAANSTHHNELTRLFGSESRAKLSGSGCFRRWHSDGRQPGECVLSVLYASSKIWWSNVSEGVDLIGNTPN